MSIEDIVLRIEGHAGVHPAATTEVLTHLVAKILALGMREDS